jgi:O-antigen/teichoic acid export membrane protein
MTHRMPLIVSLIGLGVALVAAVAGVGSLGLGELDVVSDDAAASLGVASIICSLISVPIGLVGRRWARRRGEPDRLGTAAAVIGGATFAAWFLLFVYALSKDTS